MVISCYPDAFYACSEARKEDKVCSNKLRIRSEEFGN